MKKALIDQGPKGFRPGIPFAVQPMGEIPPDPFVDLLPGIGPDPGLVELGEPLQKKSPDLKEEFLTYEAVYDHMIFSGEFVHPRKPVLQSVVVCQTLKM